MSKSKFHGAVGWRAALLQTVSQGFHYPAQDHVARVRSALRRLTEQAPPGTPATVMRALRQARGRWHPIAGEELETEYSRLFLNQVPCPMHETAYAGPGGVAGRTHELADIAGFYLAFGVRVSENQTERPDHLCTELEFISVLLLKWAHADEQGWREKRHITASAAKAFLSEHLGRWYRAFAGRLDACGAAPVYRALGDLLAAVLDAECRAWRARPTRASGEVARDVMQEDSLTCPRALADSSQRREARHACAAPAASAP